MSAVTFVYCKWKFIVAYITIEKVSVRTAEAINVCTRSARQSTRRYMFTKISAKFGDTNGKEG